MSEKGKLVFCVVWEILMVLVVIGIVLSLIFGMIPSFLSFLCVIGLLFGGFGIFIWAINIANTYRQWKQSVEK